MAKSGTKSDPTPTNNARIVKSELMNDGTVFIEAYCISTDTKPSGNICIGSKLTEVDTGKIYLYDPTENVGWTDQSFPEDAQ